VGVWSGNNDNTPMSERSTGAGVSGPLWRAFMVQAISSTPLETFIQPDPVLIDKIMLNGKIQYVKDDQSDPEIHTVLYYVNRNNPLGAFPSDPKKDSQFENWESSVKLLYPQLDN
jgi:membrane carboxypeptidase/penicillin-binding protein